MKRIVMKFGGTSVGNADALRRTSEIIRQVKETNGEVVVVVSAMAGVTDGLIACMHAAEAGDGTCGQKIAALQAKTTDVLVEMFENDIPDDMKAALADKFAALVGLCGQIQIAGQSSPKRYAALVSLGERINVIILSALLNANGIEAVPQEASNFIITDHRFYNASPIEEATRYCIHQQLKPILVQGVVPVVTGFIGSNRQGEITTLGRGGSDYSAAVIARELHADELWIWKDVDGILTTDPKLLPEAQLVREISFNETYELAYYGAKVLHPKTLLTARDGEIPIRLMNTFNPDGEGTLISPQLKQDSTSFKAVTGIDHVDLVSVESLERIGGEKVSSIVSDFLRTHEVEVLAAFETPKDHSLHFAMLNRPADEVIQQLREILNALIFGEPKPKVWVWNGRGIVSVIGQDASQEEESVHKTLTEAGIDVGDYACQKSNHSMQVLVPVSQVKKAIQSIHSEVILHA